MENIITKQEMESVKILAETNMKISDAKNLLFKLQAEETEYLISRESKVLDRIKVLYEKSDSIFKETQNNYQGVKETLQLVTDATTFLNESHAKFNLLLKDFKERNESWDEKVKKQEEVWSELKKKIDFDKILIKNDKEGLEQLKLTLAQEKRKIEDERGTLSRAIERLKHNLI